MWVGPVRRYLSALSVLAGAAVLILATSAFALPNEASASGGIGVRLIASAGSPPDDSLARSYIVEQLAPGASISRQVEITNTTSATAAVAVYPAAAAVVGDSFEFAAGHGQDQLSSWTSLNLHALRLAPGAEAADTVTITAPADASPGEHYAVVWAQMTASAPNGGGVTLINRVGVRMYVSIGSGGAQPANFDIAPLRAARSANGAPVVATTVHDIGPGPLELSGNLTLSDGPGGLSGGPFQLTLGAVLAPGASEPVTAVLGTALPPGPWRAVLTLTSGLTQHTTTATITFPLNTGAPKAPRPGGIPTLSITVIALSVGLALTAVAFGLSRHRRPRRRPSRPPASSPAA